MRANVSQGRFDSPDTLGCSNDERESGAAISRNGGIAPLSGRSRGQTPLNGQGAADRVLTANRVLTADRSPQPARRWAHPMGSPDGLSGLKAPEVQIPRLAPLARD